jgi:hypothetical protein
MSTTTARGGACALVLAVTLLLLAGPAGAASSNPTSPKAIAGLLAAKKLGCTNFSAASTSSGGSSSTLPPALSQIALLLGGAHLGTCTINGQQTLLVAFKNANARHNFEGTLADLPCAVVQAALPSTPSTTGPSGGSSPGNITLTLVDLGSLGVVFSTGTAPDSDQLDLAKAATTDSSIASKVGAKVRTITYPCA